MWRRRCRSDPMIVSTFFEARSSSLKKPKKPNTSDFVLYLLFQAGSFLFFAKLCWVRVEGTLSPTFCTHTPAGGGRCLRKCLVFFLPSILRKTERERERERAFKLQHQCQNVVLLGKFAARRVLCVMFCRESEECGFLLALRCLMLVSVAHWKVYFLNVV